MNNKEKKLRILGIDFGLSRCGISITDELGIIAQGLETIHYKNNNKLLFLKLNEIIEKYNPNKIVVGLPISMKGNKTKQTEETEKFIHKLKCKYNKIIIETIDERLTSVQAHKTMNQLKMKNKKKKDSVDKIAAIYILETYINKKENI